MRLFIGLDVPDSFKHRLLPLQTAMLREHPGRAVSDALWHITLRFLGETPEHAVSALFDVVEAQARAFASVQARLAQCAVMGRPPRAVGCVEVEPEPLLALHESLSTALEPLGWPREERPYRPHITLCRDMDARSLTGIAETGAGLSFTAKGVTLFHSTRENGRLVYRPLCVAPFQARFNETGNNDLTNSLSQP